MTGSSHRTCLAIGKKAAVIAVPGIVQDSLAEGVEDILLILKAGDFALSSKKWPIFKNMDID